MSKKQIFPDTIINNLTESVISEFRVKTNKIYIITLSSIFASIIATLFIHIEIGVKSSGVIKPIGEHNTITSPITGILNLNIKENQTVNKGDTLFIVKSDYILAQLPALKSRKEELELMIRDLTLITDYKPGENINMMSPVYRQVLTSYTAQWLEYDYKEQTTQKIYLRDKQLFERHVISLSEFEIVEAEYKNAKLSMETFQRRQKSQWQTDKNNLDVELREINTKISQIEIQTKETIALAPISGSIQKIENLASGVYVHSGQQIVIISPDGDLFIECHILPKDIGLIKEGLKCKIQVDAFNYNQWGMLEGEIKEVLKDVVVPGGDQLPFYRAYCTLYSDKLYLSNGYEGQIKKGMTVSTRFIVTERTVFQLLYDKVDNWLNPNIAQKNL